MSDKNQDDKQKNEQEKLETREAGKNVPVEEDGLLEEHKDGGKVMEVDEDQE